MFGYNGLVARKRYDWSAVQRYYDDGHSYRECRAKFGFYAQAWSKAKARGEIRPRERSCSVEELLRNCRWRINIKRRLLRAGILENRCDECGISEWHGQALSIQLDHINGVRDDFRLENLRMLCPNCHSQTHTYGGRNVRHKRLQESPRLV